MPRPDSLPQRRAPCQERSRFTVEQILQAAAQIFQEHGYARGTTNRVAERAGVSVGTLYQYFPDKDAILIALALRHIERAQALLGELLETRVTLETLPRFLDQVFRAMLALHTHAPRLHQVIFDEAPWPPDLRDALQRTEAALVEQVAQSLSTIEGLKLPEPRVTAWLLVLVTEAAAHEFVLHPPIGIQEDAFVRESVRMLVGYLGMKPDESA